MKNQLDYAWKPTRWSELKKEFPNSCVMCTNIVFDEKYPQCLYYATVTPIAVIPAEALKPTMEIDLERQTGCECTPLFTTQRGYCPI